MQAGDEIPSRRVALHWIGGRLAAFFLLVLAMTWPPQVFALQALPILVYHQIRITDDGPADSETAVSLARFEAQMRYLHDQGYVTLGMDEVIRFMKEGRSPSEKIVAIHFDDGWASVQYAIPVLERFGFKASFWIIAGSGIGWPHVTWDAVRAIAQNPRFEVFSHTMTHPWKEHQTLIDWMVGDTPGKGAEQVRWELTESRRVLEEKLGHPVPYLAWPRGLYSDVLLGMAQQAGYRALLTIDDGLNYYGGDILRIHRTMVHGGCDERIFRQIVTDGRYRNCPSPAGAPGR